MLINTSAYEDDTIMAFISLTIPETLSQSDLILQPYDPQFSDTGLSKPSIIKSDKIATLIKAIFNGAHP